MFILPRLPTLHYMAPLLFQVPLVSAGWSRTSGGGNKGKATQRNFGGEGEGAQEEEEGLLDRPLWSYVSDRITRLLREGLGDRCVLARPLCGVSGEAGEDFRGERQSLRQIHCDFLCSVFTRTSSLLQQQRLPLTVKRRFALVCRHPGPPGMGPPLCSTRRCWRRI